MSIHVVRMPDLGEGIAEVELVAWRVQPGQAVAEDQILADVMTDKATIELPSPVAGRVLALGGEVGQVLAVGAELIRIEMAGAGAEAEAEAEGPSGAGAGASKPSGPSSAVNAPAAQAAREAAMSSPAAALPVAPKPVRGEPASRPIASPAVRARAWELGIELAQVRATGAGGTG